MASILSKKNRLIQILSVALQTQASLAICFLFCLLISYFYYFVNDIRYPKEKPELIWLGLGLSLFSYILGKLISKKNAYEISFKSLKDGAFAVVLTWIIACSISAIVFVAAGFPDPFKIDDYSLFRRFTDGFYESMSGFTTAGGSILPNVEVFTRGVLMWRSMTHFIGGMGIVFMSLIIIKNVKFNREILINNESEGPNYTTFDNDKDVVVAGYDFFKIYGLITLALVILLIYSGLYFRDKPYERWYENVYDSINHAVSVMGTGGFGTYNLSVGLRELDGASHQAIGGLSNPTSEWIIAIFMIIAGSNLGLWYSFVFMKNFSVFIKSAEFKTYLAIVLGLSFAIWLVHLNYRIYESNLDAFRYSLFNVASIISTTGLATSDFTRWPASAEGLLFICYLLGGMVGSTAGGLKILRFNVLYKYVVMKIQNLLYGRHKTRFTIDAVRYSESSSGLIVSNIVLYYLIFMLGAILIMIVSPSNLFPDGTVKQMDFISAITATIANLGNIGPMVSIGNINAGPTGNYFPFSVTAKWVMIILMLIGRLGVITILTLFITKTGSTALSEVQEKQHFDSDNPILHS